MADYSKNQNALLLINSLEISLKRKHKLIGLAEEPYMLVENTEAFFADIARTVGTENAIKFKANVSKGFLNDEYIRLARYGISLVSYLDADYPKALDELYEKPLLLYCKGNTKLLNSECISVVGTREPTRYGLNVTAEFVGEFAKAGLTVVSGLARGIDAMAHRTAVEFEKPTIAVVANGLDIVYPSENKQLAERILSTGGLIITEYRPGTKPSGYQFPERNRIICGLSKGLFVPEARLSSGSLITVNLALEQGKTPYVIPSNLNSEQGKGTNMLLRDMQGCLVLEPEDVLRDYGVLKQKPEKREAVQLSISEQAVADALRAGELHFEQLIAVTGLTVNELSALLIQMEINDIIDKIGGNYYQLK